MPWGPLGAGFLTGAFTSRADLQPGDLRLHHHTKMSEENFDKVLCTGRHADGNLSYLLRGSTARGPGDVGP